MLNEEWEMMPIKNRQRAKPLKSIDWSSSSLIVVDGKGIFKSKYRCYVLFYE
jgi:hypothetical protein